MAMQQELNFYQIEALGEDFQKVKQLLGFAAHKLTFEAYASNPVFWNEAAGFDPTNPKPQSHERLHRP